MNINHVVPRVYTDASGVTHAVTGLCSSLGELSSINLNLYLLKPVTNKVQYNNNYNTYSYNAWPLLYRLGYSYAMFSDLKKSCLYNDIIHNHSLWMAPNIFPGFAIKGTSCKQIVSPHGTLSENALKRSHLLKNTVWKLWQEKALSLTVCFHASSLKEYNDIRSFGINKPVAIIPYGINIPQKTALFNNSPKRLLFLSRIHPIKGLENLLYAWQTIYKKYPDWILSIVGPDENRYLSKIISLKSKLKLDHIEIIGPLYGNLKSEMYQSSNLFILPSHTENFGYSIAEALSYGVPAIVSKNAPWNGLLKHNCGWWIDNSIDSLVQTLTIAMSLNKQELVNMGQRGRLWMKKDYSWNTIAKNMESVYNWILSNNNKPNFVYEN